MKVVILCGGKGTRLREETEYRPKPMVPIGGCPILWHIMKIYAHYGHKEFILCLGYKGAMIKEFFRNYMWNTSDTTLMLGSRPAVRFHDLHDELDWQVTLAETGEESMTAFRVKQIQRHIPAGEPFLLTYGDGLAAIDINASISAHHAAGKVCTISAVHPAGRFGIISVSEDGNIHQFNEKPQFEDAYVNGGYMVCDHRLFDYLPDDPAVMLERQPMDRLVRDGQLNAYKHEGFWQPMDTYQEMQYLNQLWAGHKAPWKVW
ncbi:MAG: glucose-1-phosphate cytidylyltransferase [Verrucomicrobiales bacterium]|jgi:glucose-1-phosphate cytidylyltransferase|nr:glucose-1-phosphate cytidylyltransferase [Verrucomicrobiales bacterium]